ncbi:hypothetical protein ACRN9N_20415 [Shewanella baltica]|uniref:hypothetical protein n=1 Tax=Shewanella baltica TaxID=62322 RepID=UPI003D7B366F
MAAKKQTTDKPEVKNADTGTGQSTATGTEQSTATGTEQGAGDGGQVNGDGEGDSQNQGQAATSETAPQVMVTVTLKTSFYCHDKEVSFTAGDDYDCDAETAKRLISNNMAKR